MNTSTKILNILKESANNTVDKITKKRCGFCNSKGPHNVTEPETDKYGIEKVTVTCRYCGEKWEEMLPEKSN